MRLTVTMEQKIRNKKRGETNYKETSTAAWAAASLTQAIWQQNTVHTSNKLNWDSLGKYFINKIEETDYSPVKYIQKSANNL